MPANQTNYDKTDAFGDLWFDNRRREAILEILNDPEFCGATYVS